jgi:hypothetical protein
MRPLCIPRAADRDMAFVSFSGSERPCRRATSGPQLEKNPPVEKGVSELHVASLPRFVID